MLFKEQHLLQLNQPSSARGSAALLNAGRRVRSQKERLVKTVTKCQYEMLCVFKPPCQIFVKMEILHEMEHQTWLS